eukprot:5494699-Amphidinium_carterae.1
MQCFERLGGGHGPLTLRITERGNLGCYSLAAEPCHRRAAKGCGFDPACVEHMISPVTCFGKSA